MCVCDPCPEYRTDSRNEQKANVDCEMSDVLVVLMVEEGGAI